MTITATRVARTHRPGAVVATIVLLIFLGVTAVGGGLALVLGTTEAGLLPPDSWLEALPIVESWRVPGLVLGIGFGLGSLLTAYGVVRRPDWGWADFVQRPTGHHWSWLATILLGLGHVVWIGIEMVFLPELSILQAIYGPLGLALAILPFTHPVSEYLSLR